MAPPWTAGSSIWPWRSPQKAHPMSGWNSCLQKIMLHYNTFFMERSGSYGESKGIFHTGRSHHRRWTVSMMRSASG